MLGYLINSNYESESKKTELLLKNNEVIYAISSTSRIDFLALKKLTEQKGFIIPSGIKNGKIIKKNYFQLRNPKRMYPWQTPKRMHSKELGKLAEERILSKNTIIIPVDVFWGKAPERKDNWVKFFFRESWEGTTFIRDFFKLIFHGRNVKIFFHKPLETYEIFDAEDSDKNLILKIERLLRARFRRNRQAFIGPDISNRNTLVASILNSSSVKNIIANEAHSERKIQKLETKAKKYAWEICSDISYPVIDLYDKGLSWFWNSRYENLNCIGYEEIKKIAPGNSLIFSPCHRSHIDYLALSYLLYYKDLMLPQIVAGKNLNLPVLGSFLRKGGAFFMRRSFGNNRLYSAVFFEHLRLLMQRGNSIEFFPEGGRSRSGRLMPPRPGIISMIIRSFKGMTERPVFFVPISMNYEKVLEGNSFLKEIMGGRKRKESLKDLFSVFKDFRNHLGEAYLQFSTPINLKEFLDNNYPDWDKKDESDKNWLFDATPALGKKIMTNINESVVVTSTSLFALAILNSEIYSTGTNTLKKRISLYASLIDEDIYSKKILIPEKTPEVIIEKVKKLNLIKDFEANHSISLSRDDAARLSFYKNNIAHLLIIESLICGFFQKQKEISITALSNLIKIIYPFLKQEYFLKWDIDEIDEIIKNKINLLKKNELISQKEDKLIRPNYKHDLFIETVALGRIVQPSIDRFFILLTELWKYEENHISKIDLENKCVKFSKSLQEKHLRISPEFSEKWVFDSFLNQLIDSKFVKEDEKGLVFPSLITKKILEEAQVFINSEWLNELSNSTET